MRRHAARAGCSLPAVRERRPHRHRPRPTLHAGQRLRNYSWRRTTTAAEAQVATASGRSASATPRRSGWSRSIVDRAGVLEAEARAPVRRELAPQVAVARRAARGACGARAGRASRARAPPRTGRRGRWSRSRSRSARRRRGGRARGSGRRRGCPRSSGRRRRSCRSRPAAPRRRSSTWMPWITLVRGPRNPVRCSSSMGETPCSARHSSSSRGCSWAWTWRTRPCASAYAAIASSQPAGTARTLCAATPTWTPSRARRPRAQRVDAREVGSTSGSQKRRWPGEGGRSRRPSPRGGRRRAAARCAARRARGLGDRDRHRVRVGVRRPVGLVVDVVELAHRAVAGGGHLGVHAPRRLAHGAGVVRAGEPVHRLAPGPEVVGGVRLGRRPLGRAAQVALERVRVRVDHRRQRGQPVRSVRHARRSRAS